jgi:hypothetical protein
MNKRNINQFSVVCLLFLLLNGCVIFSDHHNWKAVSAAQFRREVEGSGSDEFWNYSGSDNSHHYFFRMTAKLISIRPRIYRRVSKADIQGISRAQEVPFDGKPTGVSFAFTRRKKNGNGFTHSLARGLVYNILEPLP